MCHTSEYPRCCGGAIITGFDGTDEQERRQLLACLTALPAGRIVNFVMNQRQIDRYPLTLAAAANAGFVISASWINDVHGSRLVEFQRCGKRRNINTVAREIGWQGQLINAGMQGDLPRFDNAIGPVNNDYADRNGQPLHVGDRVRIESPSSRYTGHEVVITAIRFNYDGWTLQNRYHVCFTGNDGREGQVIQGNVVKVEAGADAPAPVPVHLYDQMPIIEIDGGDGPQVIEREPTVLFRTYHNIFRDGRRGAGFDTEEEARQAAPRARSMVVREIWSDGRVDYTDL
jgi:hypothetical protein